MSSELSIIVPTFCEADNLAELVTRINAAVSDHFPDFEIIIVDDDSPDGTVERCGELRQDFPVYLETRSKERGLATAVMHGLAQARGAILVVMDADLSHPPEAIPNLVDAIHGGADMAIGSRYVSGGDTDDRWGLLRWLNSRIATLLARPLTSVKDPMAGFFAVSKATYTRAENLQPIGYKIGLEILVKCGCRDVQEIPIRFSDRTRGQSKLNWQEQWNYLAHLRRLYLFKIREFADRSFPKFGRRNGSPKNTVTADHIIT